MTDATTTPDADTSTEIQARKTPAEIRRERDTRAASLRTAGYAYAEIARAVGFKNAGGAWKAVERVRNAALRETGSELLSLELERLDVLQRAQMTKALQGDAKATNAVLRVMEQRARLTGLYEARNDALVADAREAFSVFLQAARQQYPEPLPVLEAEIVSEPAA